jgi:hypothetical protein
MIPLRIDIWHNLERIFLAGLSGDEDEVECDRYASHSPLTVYVIILFFIAGLPHKKRN